MTNPLDLAVALGAILDRLGVDYAIGGSVASSFFGEPRSTLDVDIALSADTAVLLSLLDEVAVDFYIPKEAAERAISTRDSFNLLHHDSGVKVDLFVLGDELLDQLQIERRVRVTTDLGDVWVTSPEDIVLRKLWWFAKSDETSQRQWNDVLALLRVSVLDHTALADTANQAGLGPLLERALAEAYAV